MPDPRVPVRSRGAADRDCADREGAGREGADRGGALRLVDAVDAVEARHAGGASGAFVLHPARSGWAVGPPLPVDGLVGWRAPAWCRAVAVSARGTVVPAPEACTARSTGPSAPPAPSPDVTLTVVVDRAGDVAARLHAGGTVSTDPPIGGRLLDSLRRTFGLPTPPPSEGTARLLAVLWLAAVVRLASAGTREPPWSRVLTEHPAVALLLARGERLRVDEMERIVAVSASTWTWDVLRDAEAAGGAMTPLCPPGAARWMDTGFYARWVSADLPDPGRLHRAATAGLTPPVARRLTRALAASGLPAAGTVRLAG